MYVEMSVSSGYLLIRVPVVDIERVHGLHNGHDGLQGVAVDDGNELQAFFKRVTIFVDNSGEKNVALKKCNLQSTLKESQHCSDAKSAYFICLTIVLLPDSPAPVWKKNKN